MSVNRDSYSGRGFSILKQKHIDTRYAAYCSVITRMAGSDMIFPGDRLILCKNAIRSIEVDHRLVGWHHVLISTALFFSTHVRHLYGPKKHRVEGHAGCHCYALKRSKVAGMRGVTKQEGLQQTGAPLKSLRYSAA